MTVRVRGAVMLAAVLGGLACGGGSGNDNNPPAPMASAVLVRTTPSLAFQPRVDSIARTGRVTWTWDAGSQDHNIIRASGPTFTDKGTTAVPGVNEQDYFDDPEQYQFQFNTAGTLKYYCSTHGNAGNPDDGLGMAGLVVVVP